MSPFRTVCVRTYERTDGTYTLPVPSVHSQHPWADTESGEIRSTYLKKKFLLTSLSSSFSSSSPYPRPLMIIISCSSAPSLVILPLPHPPPNLLLPPLPTSSSSSTPPPPLPHCITASLNSAQRPSLLSYLHRWRVQTSHCRTDGRNHHTVEGTTHTRTVWVQTRTYAVYLISNNWRTRIYTDIHTNTYTCRHARPH